MYVCASFILCSFRFMVVLTLSFLGKSLITLLTVVDGDLFYRSFSGIQSLYLTINLIALVTVLILYSKLVDVAKTAYTSQKVYFVLRRFVCYPHGAYRVILYCIAYLQF